MKKKNIAILVNRMTGAGPARVASNLSIYLSDKYYNKTIVIYDAEESTYQVNGNIINLNIKGRKTMIGKIYSTLKRVVILRKIKKQHKISATISLMPNPNIVNILSKVNDKIIVSERSFASKNFKGLFGIIYKSFYKNFYNKSYQVIAVSKGVKEDLIKNFGVRRDIIKVIYNFYDIKKISLLANNEIEEKELFEKPTIITAGRLAHEKGQWHLIRAFTKVKKEIPDVELIILGEEGKLEEYLKILVDDLKISKDIHFLGFKKNPFKYLSKANVFVFPSLFEGFPNALSEAMICGLPVISSDCESGPRELLSPNMDITEPMVDTITYGEYGILVPTCDGNKYEANITLTREENILADAILELLNKKDVRDKYSSLSKERINDFRENLVMKDWEEIINE